MGQVAMSSALVRWPILRILRILLYPAHAQKTPESDLRWKEKLNSFYSSDVPIVVQAKITESKLENKPSFNAMPVNMIVVGVPCWNLFSVFVLTLKEHFLYREALSNNFTTDLTYNSNTLVTYSLNNKLTLEAVYDDVGIFQIWRWIESQCKPQEPCDSRDNCQFQYNDWQVSLSYSRSIALE